MLNYITPDEAVRAVKSGDHIHISSAAQLPYCLLQALERRADAGEITDIHVHHSYSDGPAPFDALKYEGVFFDQAFFIGPSLRKSVNQGAADYIPIHLSQTQAVYRKGIVPCDVAMVLVSEPDERGYVSLGGDVVCSVGAIEMAKTVIGVVNKNVPFTYGDSIVPVSRFTHFVRHDRELLSTPVAIPTPEEVQIGKTCASLIEDGACLQIGIGGLTNALAAQLEDHKNLGFHSETFADGVLHLIKKGIINGSNKVFDKGKVVASFILGSREVFDFVDHNPGVMMMDIGYTNDPYIIGRNPNVASVNTATQIDLTGQVCADSVGSRILSGTGGQLEFVRGAFLSKKGISIIAVASRTKNGISKIVPALDMASGVVTPRADIQWVVTEYGAVNLLGKSLQERAKLLTSIAHPDDREMLDRAAFERFGGHYKAI